MASHSRLSPGVEFREIDRSAYGKQDYSITGTTVFMTGFASRGEDYTPQWVNTAQTFRELYGEPANEPERYFYNGVREVLDRGGVAVVSKLPYDNASKDMFTAVNFRVVQNPAAESVSCYVSALSSLDPSLTSVMSIESDPDTPTRKIGVDELDRFRVSNSLGPAGTNDAITVVDITRGEYSSVDMMSDSGTVADGVECLGIMPVITTPVNAMFYQGVISSGTVTDGDGYERTAGLGLYEPVSDMANRTSSDVFGSGFAPGAVAALSAEYSEFGSVAGFGQNLAVPLSAETVRDQSVSRMASEQFPVVTYDLARTLDRTHLKHVGLVVFAVYRDPSNDNRIQFDPVESFVGSLDRLSKNETNGASDYIGNIVNSSSRYVNVFANVRTGAAYRAAQTYVTRGQKGRVLGFASVERAKHVDYKNSVVDPLNIILGRIQDPNQVRIDVVADAGVSNVAGYAAGPGRNDRASDAASYDLYNADAYPFVQKPGGGAGNWTFSRDSDDIRRWYAVQQKLDNFCKYDRRDCMFVADGFRPLVLDGNEKIVRNTNRVNTIANAIIPNLRYLTGLNSSYSAGYCNWFYAQDASSGDFFWTPPSVKAAGVYVYTDAYCHPWDAPAGLNRGVVPGAYDVSFDPRNDEAGRIYQQAWNYAVAYPMEGVVLEGQKTFQLKPTALDRVNVRRLMLWLEKRVVAIARRFLYEGNTQYTRQRFLDSIRPVFEEAKAGDGVVDYAVRCDDELNTANVVDRNELRCVCAVKPVKTIEYIKINFIITNQSASVSEEVMK